VKRKFSKILGVGLALVLVLTLGLVTVPVSANPGGIELVAKGDSTAEWVTDPIKIGSYSAELAMPAGTGWVNDNAEVQIDVSEQGLTLAEMSWSFWTLTPTGMESYALPIEFYADLDGDGTADKIIAGNILKKSVPATDQWYDMSPELWKSYGGAFYVWKEDGTGFEFSVGPDPWAEAVNRWGEAEIVRIDLGFGHLGSNEAATAYADDLTINGVVYELEPPPPTEVYVDDDWISQSDVAQGLFWGWDAFATIQDGINNVAEGGTINVAAGTYVESPTTTVPLNLVGVAGEDDVLPTLVGTLTINSISYLDSDNMLIDNMNFLVVESTTECADSIVLKKVDGVTISNCSFDGNDSFIVGYSPEGSALGPRAVQMYPSPNSNVTIDNCTFKDGYYTAISGYVSNLTVTASSIENCKSGINLQGGNNLVVKNTDISVVAQGLPDTYCVRFASSSIGSGTDMNITGGILAVDKAGLTPEAGNYHSAIIVRAGATGDLKVEGVSIGGEVVNLSTTQLDATNNWWGNASGPQPDEAVYTSYGDKVSTGVDYNPWLLAEGSTTYYDKTLALKDGWTLISTDKAVATGAWVGTNPLAVGLSETAMALKYTYTPIVGFVPAELTDLEPLTAIYVLTKGGGGVGFNYAEGGDPAFYSKELEAGWNLTGVPDIEATTGAILSPLRYVTVGTQQVIGLTTLVSQGDYNQFSNSFHLATFTDTDWDGLPLLYPFDGYWANMEAADTLEVPVD